MGIVLTDTTKEQKQSFAFDGGVFVNKCTIVNAEDISGEEVGKNGFVPEIGILLTLDIGQSFNPKLYLFGKFNRDKKTGEVKGWQKYADVGIFLARVLGERAVINDDFTIPESTIKKLKDKEIWRLQYCAGTYNDKPNFQTFNRVISSEHAPEELYQEFLERSAWIKDYTPEVWNAYQEEEKREQESFDASKYQTGGDSGTTSEDSIEDII